MLSNQRSPNFDRDFHNIPSVVCDGSGIAYNIGALLGRGGFAKCYLAHSDRQEFALKVIAKSSIKKESYLNKIRKEVHTHFKLRHPHIVTLYDTFDDANNIYMLLEYCPNRTLAEFIESSPERRVTELTSIIFLKQLLKAVRYLHVELGILHRDIKPGNILLSRENTVKLADFGFCCSIAELERRRTHTVCGTPNYVPAEVLDRFGHSIYSESWSIACTFYCMLFGRPPFHSDCQELTYTRIRKCCYTFPSVCNVSREAKDLISRVLVRDSLSRLTTEEMLLHPLFSKLNRCVSYANGLNQTRATSRYRRVSGDFTSTDSSSSAKKFTNKNTTTLIDSGLGSGGDLCAPVFANNTRKWDVRTLLNHCISVLAECIDSFDPVYLSPISPILCGSFIAKWVDYTNKFGFGVTLKDGTRSLLLNDNSAVSISHTCSRFSFCANKFCHNVKEWPATHLIQDPAIAEKFQFLSFLRTYMDRELYSSVRIGSSFSSSSSSAQAFSSHHVEHGSKSSNVSSTPSSSTNSNCTKSARRFHSASNDFNEDTYANTSMPNRCSRSIYHANIEYGGNVALHPFDIATPIDESLVRQPTVNRMPPMTYLIDVWKCPAGLLMLLSDGTYQMNMAESRYKVVIRIGCKSESQPKLNVYVVTPEHAVFAFEAVTSYDLNRTEPSEEFILQLSTLKRTLQQYYNARMVPRDCNATSQRIGQNETRSDNTTMIHPRHEIRRDVDLTAQRLVRLRSSTDC